MGKGKRRPGVARRQRGEPELHQRTGGDLFDAIASLVAPAPARTAHQEPTLGYNAHVPALPPKPLPPPTYPVIRRYVELLFTEDSGWPSEPSWQDRLPELQTLAEREARTSVDPRTLRHCVHKLVLQQLDVRFYTRLRPDRRGLSSRSRTREWADALASALPTRAVSDEGLVCQLARVVVSTRWGIPVARFAYHDEEQAIRDALAVVSQKLLHELPAATERYAHAHRVTRLERELLGHTPVATARPVAIQDVDQMTGPQFEQLLVRLFENMGFGVTHLGGAGDQGADLIIQRADSFTAVQAKRYDSRRKVDNTAVQEVIAAQVHYRCHETLVVTSSVFTEGAREIARSGKVTLWDRSELIRLLARHRVLLG